ncbi:enoyl-CoA hydratase/isomerase family protein [Chloroflexota bacterium]
MEQSYSTILFEQDEAVPEIVYITLNRPEKSNAISIGPDNMTGEVQDAIKRAENHEDIKVIIFRGKGKNFSAGFDLSQVYRVYGGGPGVRPPQAARLRVDEDHIIGLRRAILDCKKLVMTQIHGWCIEAAIFFAEASDIAIAANNAKFTHRGQRLAFGGTIPFPFDFTMGLSKKNMELLLTGRTISAEEAEQIGIITKAVEPEILEQEVYNLAKALCLYPSDAIAIGKMSRRHILESLGLTSMLAQVTYHTLATNLHYSPKEKESAFIRNREKMGEKEAFDMLHKSWEDALDKTENFKSYR